MSRPSPPPYYLARHYKALGVPWDTINIPVFNAVRFLSPGAISGLIAFVLALGASENSTTFLCPPRSFLVQDAISLTADAFSCLISKRSGEDDITWERLCVAASLCRPREKHMTKRLRCVARTLVNATMHSINLQFRTFTVSENKEPLSVDRWLTDCTYGAPSAKTRYNTVQKTIPLTVALTQITKAVSYAFRKAAVRCESPWLPLQLPVQEFEFAVDAPWANHTAHVLVDAAFSRVVQYQRPCYYHDTSENA